MMSDLEIVVKIERGYQKWEDMIKLINTVIMIKVSNNNARQLGKYYKIVNKI